MDNPGYLTDKGTPHWNNSVFQCETTKCTNPRRGRHTPRAQHNFETLVFGTFLSPLLKDGTYFAEKFSMKKGFFGEQKNN